VKRGWLIAFEGLDGSGKTTQLALLASRLREAGHDVVETREPTDGPYGRRIRDLARGGGRASPERELRWFVEDRRRHVAAVIRPALEAERVVLTDRYFLSSVGYQGARGLDPDRILADSEAEFPLPDLAILLEIDPADGLARVGSRAGAKEPGFEDPDFLARVSAILARVDRAYLVRIDARPEPAVVARAVAEAVCRRLGLP
jgi:dTMP kinase